MLINKRKFSIKNDKKLLHKVGKQWVTISVAMLALLGAGVVTTETTHAESNQDKSQIQVNVTKSNLNQKLANANHHQTSQNNSGNSQSAAPVSGNQPTTPIEKAAKGLHSNLINNATKVASSASNSNNSTANNNKASSQSSASSSKAKAMTPHINSAYANYLKQMGGNSAYDKLMNKEVQSQNTNNTKNNKPKVNLKLTKDLTDIQQGQPNADKTHWIYTSDGNGHVSYLSSDQVNDWQSSTSDYDGLSYRYSPNTKAIEFTGGNLNRIQYNVYGFNYYEPLLGNYSDSSDNKHSACPSSINLSDIVSVNMGNITPSDSFQNLFQSDSSLQSLNFGHVNTTNVSDMMDMFSGTSLKSLVLSSDFDMRNANSMYDGDIFFNIAPLQTLIIQSPNSVITNSLNWTMYRRLPNKDSSNKNYTLSVPSDFSNGNVGTFTSISNPAPNQVTPKVSFNDIYGKSDGLTPPSSIIKDGLKVDDNNSYTVTVPSGWAVVNPNNGTLASTDNRVNDDKKSFTFKLNQGNQIINIAPVYRGLTYKYDKNNHSVDFINGTAGSDLSNFIPNAPSDIKNSSAITFENNVDVSNVTNMSRMFSDISLQSLNLGNNFNTSNVTNMSKMFCDNYLHTLNLGNNFNTSNVTNMSGMFEGDYSLPSLSLGSQFNTNKVTNMSSMFYEDPSLLVLTLPNNFNTSNVTDMSRMFESDHSLQSLNLGDNFDTSKVTNMDSMFYVDEKLSSLVLPKSFNTSNVTDMYQMFGANFSLKFLTLPSDFDTRKAYNTTSEMFVYYPSNLTLTIKSHNTRLSPMSNNIYGDLKGPMYKQLDKKDSTGKNYTYPVPNNFSKGNIGTFVNTPNFESKSADLAYSDIYSNIDGFKNLPSDTYAPGCNLNSDWSLVNADGNVSSTPVKVRGKVLIAPTEKGLVYKYNKNDHSVEFTGGTADSDLTDFLANLMSTLGTFNIKTIKFDNKINISNVINMSSMLANDSSLQSLDLGDNFNTSNVISMQLMFMDDNSLQSLNLGNKFYTKNVGRSTARVPGCISNMFDGDSKLQYLNLGNNFIINTKNFEDSILYSYMFGHQNISTLQMGGNSLLYIDPSEYLNKYTSNGSDPSSNIQDPSAYTNQDPNEVSSNYLWGPNKLILSSDAKFADVNSKLFKGTVIYPTTNHQQMTELANELDQSRKDFDNANQLKSSDQGSLESRAEDLMNIDFNSLIKHLKNGTPYIIPNDSNKSNASYTGILGYLMDYPTFIGSISNGSYINVTSDLKPLLTSTKYIRPYDPWYRELGDSGYTASIPVNMYDGQSHPGTWLRQPNPHPDTIQYHDIYSSSDQLATPSNKAIKSAGGTYTTKRSDIPVGWSLVNSSGQVVNNDEFTINGGNHSLDIAPAYNGMTYKYNKNNKSVEFVSGTPNPDLKDFINDAPNIIKNASSITFDNDIDFSHVTNMSHMFTFGQESTLNLGNNFNTSNVADMKRMFAGNGNLKSLTLPSGFSTASIYGHNVKKNNMNGMFYATPLNQLTINSSNAKLDNTIQLPSMYKQYNNKDNSGHYYTSDTPTNFNMGDTGTFVLNLNSQPSTNVAYEHIRYEYKHDTATYHEGSDIIIGTPDAKGTVNGTSLKPGWHLTKPNNTFTFGTNGFSDVDKVGVSPDPNNAIVQYTYKGNVIASDSRDFHGNDARAKDAGNTSTNITSANDAGIPANYHLVNASTNVPFNGDVTAVAVAPNQVTDTVNYMYNGKIVGSHQFTGNYADASGALNTTFDAGVDVPTHYHTVNSNNTISYDGQTHTVNVAINPYTDTISYHDIYSDIDGMTNPSNGPIPSGTGKYQIKNSDVPDGYALVDTQGHIVNNSADDFSYDNGNHTLNVAPVWDGMTYKYDKSNHSLEFIDGTPKTFSSLPESNVTQIIFDKLVPTQLSDDWRQINGSRYSYTPNELTSGNHQGTFIIPYTVQPEVNNAKSVVKYIYNGQVVGSDQLTGNLNKIDTITKGNEPGLDTTKYHLDIDSTTVPFDNGIHYVAVIPNQSAHSSNNGNGGSQQPSVIPSPSQPTNNGDTPVPVIPSTIPTSGTNSGNVIHNTTAPVNEEPMVTTTNASAPFIHHLDNLNQLGVGQAGNYHGAKITRLNTLKHFRYFTIIKDCLAHTNPKSVGMVKDYVKVMHPRDHYTFFINKVFKIQQPGNSPIYRYEFRAKFGKHYHYYFATNNPNFTKNAYLQSRELRNARDVSHRYFDARVIMNTHEFNKRYFTYKSRVKTLRKGTVLHIKRIINIGKKGYGQTRFQLTDGNYVTANRNFIKLINHYGYKVTRLSTRNHFRYFRITKHVLAHRDPLSIGSNKDYAKVMQPRKHATYYINGILKVQAGKRSYHCYEFRAKFGKHVSNYFVTANHSYIKLIKKL